MRSSLSMITAAPDRGLLGIVDLRAAAGVTGSAQDASLIKTGLTVADIISRWCGVAGVGLAPPTLRAETIEQTFWPVQASESLVLARRFVGTATVIEDETELAAADFTVDGVSGVAMRLRNGRPCEWSCGVITVTYEAGFSEVPTDLAEVASEMVSRRTGTSRDPMLKRRRVDIPGVEEVEEEFWVDANAAVDITPDMSDVLNAYRTIAIG